MRNKGYCLIATCDLKVVKSEVFLQLYWNGFPVVYGAGQAEKVSVNFFCDYARISPGVGKATRKKHKPSVLFPRLHWKN